MWVEICIQASISRICGLTEAKQGNQLPCLAYILQTTTRAANKTSSLKGFHVKQHCFRTTCHSFDIISFLKTSTFWINRKKWTTFSSKKVIWAFDLTLHIYRQKKSIFPKLSKTCCPHIRSRGMEQRRCSERLVSKLDTFHNLKAWSWRLTHIKVCKRNSRRICLRWSSWWSAESFEVSIFLRFDLISSQWKDLFSISKRWLKEISHSSYCRCPSHLIAPLKKSAFITTNLQCITWSDIITYN